MENDIATPIFDSLDNDHREGLLLCWKIREGFRKEIELKRIKDYVSWYWLNYLKGLFDFEEKNIFILLPKDNKLRKKAASQHKKLKKYFEENMASNYLKSLMLIEEELELHIRFAEKELQDEILKIHTPEELDAVNAEYSMKEFESWKDPFWE